MNKRIGTIIFLLLLASVASAQTNQPAPTVLKIDGEVTRPLTMSASDISKLPRRKATAKDHDSKSVVFEGVALVDLLKAAGVEFGEKLRGKNLALFLVAEATDGYRAVFALPELDPAFVDQEIILADTRDGQALSAAEGPWKIIVPNEKRHGRWVRQVMRLTVKRA